MKAPERKLAGLQQAVLGLLALLVAGLIGNRIEPLVGSLLFLGAAALLVALYPARRTFFQPGAGLSASLATISLLAAVPAVWYAVGMLARRASWGAVRTAIVWRRWLPWPSLSCWWACWPP